MKTQYWVRCYRGTSGWQDYGDWIPTPPEVRTERDAREYIAIAHPDVWRIIEVTLL